MEGSLSNKPTNFPNGVESAQGFYGPVRGQLAQTAIQALTAVSTADATDLATAVALSNANKAKINAIIAALKA